MNNIKWIKISCDFFDDEAIKLIEQMPESDSIIVIWLKLLISAGKVNDKGYIYFKKEIPYTDEMLSAVFNRPLNIIRLAIQTFKRFGMIQITDEQQIFISNWEKHQNVEGMERVRELAKMRMRKSRAKKAQLLLETKKENDVTLRNGNATVTHVDIDKEEEKELEINKEEKRKNFVAKSFFQKLLVNDEDCKKYESFKEIFIKWLEYKTLIKKQYSTEQGLKNAFIGLVNLSQKNIENAKDLVEYAISKEWRGIYAIPKKDKELLQQSKKQNTQNRTYGGF